MIWLIKREPYLLPLLLSCEWHLLDRQRPEDGNLDCVVCCLVSVSFGAEIRMHNYVGENLLYSHSVPFSKYLIPPSSITNRGKLIRLSVCYNYSSVSK